MYIRGENIRHACFVLLFQALKSQKVFHRCPKRGEKGKKIIILLPHHIKPVVGAYQIYTIIKAILGQPFPLYFFETSIPNAMKFITIKKKNGYQQKPPLLLVSLHMKPSGLIFEAIDPPSLFFSALIYSRPLLSYAPLWFAYLSLHLCLSIVSCRVLFIAPSQLPQRPCRLPALRQRHFSQTPQCQSSRR